MEILLILIVIVLVGVISIYNRIVRLKNSVDTSLSGIDVALKRRYDLIPNLVNVVKGYTEHEKEVLMSIALERGGSIQNRLDSSSNAIGTILAVAESYPELKANQNFSELSEELRNTENKISFSRQFYNDTVTKYNTKIQVFPSNIIAGMFNFTVRDLFKTDNDEARKNVKVDFGNN